MTQVPKLEGMQQRLERFLLQLHQGIGGDRVKLDPEVAIDAGLALVQILGSGQIGLGLADRSKRC